jgi:hypoxanthine phosphoribosyltransferase
VKTIKVYDKKFELFIEASEISEMVEKLAMRLNQDLQVKDVVFLGILNGAFILAADLIRKIKIDCQVTFVKMASYRGTLTAGSVETLIGIGEQLRNKTVVILEDIVDTGLTLENILKQVENHHPAKILTVALLFKPDACIKDIRIDYLGREIPNDFVIGYGLDYNGFGRNLPDVYRIIES